MAVGVSTSFHTRHMDLAPSMHHSLSWSCWNTSCRKRGLSLLNGTLVPLSHNAPRHTETSVFWRSWFLLSHIPNFVLFRSTHRPPPGPPSKSPPPVPADVLCWHCKIDHICKSTVSILQIKNWGSENMTRPCARSRWVVGTNSVSLTLESFLYVKNGWWKQDLGLCGEDVFLETLTYFAVTTGAVRERCHSPADRR